MNIQKPARLENLISDAARLNAETIALVFRDETLSFKNMEERADMLSREILRQAFSEPYIAVSCTPSVEMIVSVLAILKAGKAFVPLDPKHPQSRLRDMVEDGHFRFVLSNSSETDYFQQTGLSVIASDDNYAAPEITGFNLNETAYIIFTSGSTGKPKGVMISHSAIINYVKTAIKLYGSDDGAISGSFLHLSLAFDASLTSVFVPLCSGKLLVINYCLDHLGDIYLSGVLPIATVDLEQIDQMLGVMLQTSDNSFNILLELGFRSAIEKEWAWRTSKGMDMANLQAFAHFFE